MKNHREDTVVETIHIKGGTKRTSVEVGIGIPILILILALLCGPRIVRHFSERNCPFEKVAGAYQIKEGIYFLPCTGKGSDKVEKGQKWMKDTGKDANIITIAQDVVNELKKLQEEIPDVEGFLEKEGIILITKGGDSKIVGSLPRSFFYPDRNNILHWTSAPPGSKSYWNF